MILAICAGELGLRIETSSIVQHLPRKTGPEVVKRSSSSTQMNMKFILLINVKMPTIVGILTFISMINTTPERMRNENSLFSRILLFMSS